MALKDIAVAGLVAETNVSIDLTAGSAGPGCAGATATDIEETPCAKSKVGTALCLTGAKVGRLCPAVVLETVTELTHVKATFSAAATKVLAEGSAPLRKDDVAAGGSCTGTIVASGTPCAATFTGSIDDAGQSKVKGL